MTKVNSTLEDGLKAPDTVTNPENEGELKRTHTFWTCTLSYDHECLVACANALETNSDGLPDHDPVHLEL